MRIISYNIQYGLGIDGRYDLARIADEIRDGDIIGLQEVERYWQRSGMVDEAEALAALLPDHHWVYGANLDMDASYRDEGGKLVNRRRQFGTMVLSRFPILSSRNFPLPKFGTLDQHSIQQGLLETVIDPGIGPIRFYSVHLSHLCSETRMPQVEAILDILRRAPAEGGAWCGGHPDPAAGWTEGEMPPMPRDVVLVGDMNCTNTSPEYTTLTGPMTGRYGRLCNTDGLVDAYVAAGNDENGGSSHPAGSRIDHCFVSASLRHRVRAVSIDDTATGSDHWPVRIDLD
ncbi:endonuclease/exonuclease/phosphatase family protein [Stappia indica]|uniref:endonuclease/exonuclease/phosphatase family protein n=1 Tax=Stappia indica TaxID=538381 RepID=UPI001CD2269F|nr:endonuclease/exonuclease/phosphatase family protein [Stappia indica]MCA1298535.1 endonuclease/exonuclease/phosphatase family protein [Stappia indica]